MVYWLHPGSGDYLSTIVHNGPTSLYNTLYFVDLSALLILKWFECHNDHDFEDDASSGLQP
jgi:hypothetical protein